MASFVFAPGFGAGIQYPDGVCEWPEGLLPPPCNRLQAVCKLACNNDRVDSDLDFRVLGGIDVVRRGQPVPMGGPKPRLALAVLAAHRGSVV